MISIPLSAVVVLDVDDTLYLERDYVRSGFRAVGELARAELGLEGLEQHLWDGFLDGVRGNAFDLALVACGHEPTPALITRLVDCYRTHEPDIRLLPDAADFLRCCGDRRPALITDGAAVSQWAKVRALGLDAVAEPIMVTAELGLDRSKPHPQAYLEVEAARGALPEQCWYVADNPTKDFDTPMQRGWTSVRVRRDDGLHASRPTPAGVPEVPSLDHLHLLQT